MKLDSVNRIGIIGAGMIGDSLAVLATGHGYYATVLVRRPEMIPEYKKTYDEYFRQMIDQGLMPQEQLAICERYLTYTGDFSDLADCDVIFECVPEVLDLKHEIYAKIEETCPRQEGQGKTQ